VLKEIFRAGAAWLSKHSLADLAQRVTRKAPRAFMAEVSAWFERRKA
jgi:hypothetical protein